MRHGRGLRMNQSIWFLVAERNRPGQHRLRSRGLKAVSDLRWRCRRQALCGMEGIIRRTASVGSHPSTDRPGQRRLNPGVESSVGPSLRGCSKASSMRHGRDQRATNACGSHPSTDRPGRLKLSSFSNCEQCWTFTGRICGKLLAMWVGPNGDQQLWYASFDGANWSNAGTGPGNSDRIYLKILVFECIPRIDEFGAGSPSPRASITSTVPERIVTQCEIMTGVMRNLNIPGGPCCPPAATPTRLTQLSHLLNGPYGGFCLYRTINLTAECPLPQPQWSALVMRWT